MRTMTAIDDITAERQRQIDDEGWTPEHDDKHEGGSIGLAAAFYAAPVEIRCQFYGPCGCREAHCHHWGGQVSRGWKEAWPWKEPPKKKDRRRDLVRAGALIVAEIERIDRAAGEDT